MYYRNLSRNRAYSEMEKKSKHCDDNSPRRKTSINELSEDEIVFAYNKLRNERNFNDVKTRNEDLSSEMRAEFQRWMEMKQKDEKSNATMTSNSEKLEKVNTEDSAREGLNVVTDELETMTATENSDFDEFQDVISDREEDEDEEYLKVPLVILEDDGKNSRANETNLFENKGQKSPIPSVIEFNTSDVDNVESLSDSATVVDEENTIEAKMTLSNAPLAVVTNLSSSSISLASDKSSDEASNKKQRPAKHSKGRAPLPPSNTNVPGQFYDQVTKKYFKETEL